MSLVEDAQHAEMEATQEEAVRFAGMCLAVNSLMAGFKIIVGLLSGSHALLASALYSINDILTSMAVAISIRLGHRDPNDDYPYGYTKAEYIAAGMVSLIITFGVFFMFFFSVVDILTGVPGPPHFIAIFLAAVSMVTSWVLSRRGHVLAQALQSPVLNTHAEHHHADAEGSLLAIIGVGGALLGWHTFDRVIAVVETLHLIALAGMLLARSLRGLMDTAMDDDDLQLVESACGEVTGVREVVQVRSRQAGRRTWVDIAVAVSPRMKVVQAHRICNDVSSAVHGVLGSGVSTQVRFQGPNQEMIQPGPGGSPHG